MNARTFDDTVLFRAYTAHTAGLPLPGCASQRGSTRTSRPSRSGSPTLHVGSSAIPQPAIAS